MLLIQKSAGYTTIHQFRSKAKAAYEKRLARRQARDTLIRQPGSTFSLTTDQVFMDSRQFSTACAVGQTTLPIISSVPTGNTTKALDPDAPSFHTSSHCLH